MEKLCIVTGANGSLGRAYIEALRDANTECIGISRSAVSGPVPNVHYIEGIDLLSKRETAQAVESLRPIDRDIVLVHPVGKFLFEWNGVEGDRDGDGIDDEVYRSNVETFRNVAGPVLETLVSSRRDTRVTLCGFGSVSDPFDVPYWRSYSRSKDALRAEIRRRITEGMGRVRGLCINVSTVDTGNENLLRPYADKRYWLKPMEVVRASIGAILGDEEGWREVSVLCRKPDVDPATHYLPEVVCERWKREMGTINTLSL